MTDQKQLNVRYGADVSDVLDAQDRMASDAEASGSRVDRSATGIEAAYKRTLKPILGAGIAIGGIGLALERLGAPLEAAETRLRTTIENTGAGFDALKPKIEAVDKAAAKLGFSSTDVDDALNTLTLKLGDPKKALDKIGDAMDIARTKNISLGDAANLTAGLVLGQARAYKQFGITIKPAVDATKAVASATKAHAAAEKELTDARRRLNEIQSGAELGNDAAQQRAIEAATRDHARAVDVLTSAQQRYRDAQALVNADGKVTLSESIRLRNAHNAVTAAQQRVSSTAKDVATAQTAGGKTSVSQQQRVADAIAKVHEAENKLKTTTDGVAKAQKVGTDNATAATQNFGKVHAKEHGAAQAQANTTAGRWRALRTEVGNGAAEIGKKFGPVTGAVGGFTTAMVGITQVGGPVIGALKGIQLATLGTIGIWVLAIAAIAAIVYVIVRNWTTIKTFVTRIAKDIWTFFKKWGPDILGLILIPFGIGVAILIFKHWSSISAFLKRVWADIKGAAGAVFGFLRNAFLNFTPVGLVIKHWKAIQTGIGRIVDWLKGVPGKIVGFFAHIGDDMLHIGRSLIEGIENGIKAAGHALLSHLPGILKKFIPGPIKDFFGISSPSKMAMGWGMSISEGMAVGIENGVTRVAAASRRLAGAVRPAARIPVFGGNVVDLASRRGPIATAATRGPVVTVASGAAASGGSGAVTVINIDTHVAGSVRTERELVESIRTGLMKGGIRNSGALRRTA